MKSKILKLLKDLWQNEDGFFSSTVIAAIGAATSIAGTAHKIATGGGGGGGFIPSVDFSGLMEPIRDVGSTTQVPTAETAGAATFDVPESDEVQRVRIENDPVALQQGWNGLLQEFLSSPKAETIAVPSTESNIDEDLLKLIGA